MEESAQSYAPFRHNKNQGADSREIITNKILITNKARIVTVGYLKDIGSATATNPIALVYQKPAATGAVQL